MNGLGKERFLPGSLIANLTLGMIILKKRYSIEKYLSVILITFGIATCTIATATDVEAQPGHTGNALYDFGHALPLPGFLLVGSSIYKHVSLFNESAPLEIISGFSMPKMWFYLIANVLTQYPFVI
ncbi:hypothetical protein KUTeg_020805 [Tegillarca granosa]|uniref:Uncharacterized protein n=1 Tax=Tegillarca granosa TaxID=220873 RepID=A0ABQ9E907_TEGGR|nr:hypothetical protein KUTeg_020805 [Tegillarca granosa]